MKAVIFTGNRQLEIRDVPDPEPADDEVVLEIMASGMCGSDLHLYRSPDPGVANFIPGHEPCGVIVERGKAVSETEAPVGARFMVHHYDGCRTCANCTSGWTQLCEEGSTVYGKTGDGAHARFMKVPAHTLVPLPDDMSFVVGAAISCGTGTAYGAIKRIEMPEGETLAVFGQGPVGLSATMLGVAMGARVLAVDLSAERLAKARDYGADAIIDASKDNAVEAIKDLTGGHGAPYVLECSGSPAASHDAVKSAKIWGKVGLVGLGSEATYDVARDVIRRQVSIVGSWTFSRDWQRECTEYIAERQLPVESLFSHRFPLQDAERAYQIFDTGKTGKGVLLPV